MEKVDMGDEQFVNYLMWEFEERKRFDIRED